MFIRLLLKLKLSLLRVAGLVDVFCNLYQKNLFLLSIEGNQDPDVPVLAGLDAIVKLDGKVVAWATNLNFDEDFELQGIRTLGFHGDRGYKSQGYNCTVTVGTFVLIGDQADALPVPTRRTILTSGQVDFEVLDLVSETTLFVLSQCKCATSGVSLDSGSLSSKNTTWRCREVIPREGNVS
jgi:hypothetical protein